MRYLIKFGYDGTKFHGFQRQNNVKNVQGTLENALSKVLKSNILIKGSGRTDAGVHAHMQCAHFDYDGSVSNKDIDKINILLNNEIIINKISVVSNDFHARHKVIKKMYVYKVNNGKYKKEYVGYYYQVKYDFDIKKMKNASKLLIGTHDYHNFVSGYRDDYTSTIYNIKIKKHGDIIVFKFVGIGFYRYMIRHLVGALLDVGRGKVDIHIIENMLDKDIDKKLSVVPADGLYLEKIWY